jgi:hypothetical protein
MGLVAGAAFWNIYKGRNPGAGKNVKGKSQSKGSGGWF